MGNSCAISPSTRPGTTSGGWPDEKVQRCPETRVNDVSRHHNRAPGSVWFQDIVDGCLTTSFTPLEQGGGGCRWLTWWSRGSGSKGGRSRRWPETKPSYQLRLGPHNVPELSLCLNVHGVGRELLGLDKTRSGRRRSNARGASADSEPRGRGPNHVCAA